MLETPAGRDVGQALAGAGQQLAAHALVARLADVGERRQPDGLAEVRVERAARHACGGHQLLGGDRQMQVGVDVVDGTPHATRRHRGAPVQQLAVVVRLAADQPRQQELLELRHRQRIGKQRVAVVELFDREHHPAPQAAPGAAGEVQGRLEPHFVNDGFTEHRAEVAGERLAGEVHHQASGIGCRMDRLIADRRADDPLRVRAGEFHPPHHGNRPAGQRQLDTVVGACRRRLGHRFRAVADIAKMDTGQIDGVDPHAARAFAVARQDQVEPLAGQQVGDARCVAAIQLRVTVQGAAINRRVHNHLRPGKAAIGGHRVCRRRIDASGRT